MRLVSSFRCRFLKRSLGKCGTRLYFRPPRRKVVCQRVGASMREGRLILALGALLVWRYFTRGGGLQVLKMMNTPMTHEHAHGHGHT